MILIAKVVRDLPFTFEDHRTVEKVRELARSGDHGDTRVHESGVLRRSEDIVPRRYIRNTTGVNGQRVAFGGKHGNR